jgi:hypothetical protein
VPPSATPYVAPQLRIYNEQHTAIGKFVAACLLSKNLTWPYQLGCETVSSIWLPAARITYTLRFADGTTQTLQDIADSRGHSLVVFAVSYTPPAGSKHGSPPTVAYITVAGASRDGFAQAAAHLRFAVMRARGS